MCHRVVSLQTMASLGSGASGTGKRKGLSDRVGQTHRGPDNSRGNYRLRHPGKETGAFLKTLLAARWFHNGKGLGPDQPGMVFQSHFSMVQVLFCGPSGPAGHIEGTPISGGRSSFVRSGRKMKKKKKKKKKHKKTKKKKNEKKRN